MQLKGMKWFAKLLVMVLAVWLAAVPVMGTQAADDGDYNIAVLKVGEYWEQWTEDDFSELDVEYSWATIPTDNLSYDGLAPYNVLIVPYRYNYDGEWLTDDRKTAIVDWVNGGKLLIVHSFEYREALDNDPLMAAFGPTYRVDWAGEFCWDVVWIADDENPLVSKPNTLSSDNLSHWNRGVINAVNQDTAGSAWNWAAYTAFGMSVEQLWWLGYAFSGSGAIVVSGGNPEWRSTQTGNEVKQIAARKLIENEITLELPVPPVIEVDIDIKPGSSPNSINPDSEGIIPVAILTTDAFDAATVDASTVIFGPDAATMVHKKAHLEDVDEDGDTDMLLHFRIQDSGIEAGDTEAELTGLTFDGQEIHGIDSVRTAGKEDG